VPEALEGTKNTKSHQENLKSTRRKNLTANSNPAPPSPSERAGERSKKLEFLNTPNRIHASHFNHPIILLISYFHHLFPSIAYNLFPYRISFCLPVSCLKSLCLIPLLWPITYIHIAYPFVFQSQVSRSFVLLFHITYGI
jgi:hypothetical protein